MLRTLVLMAVAGGVVGTPHAAWGQRAPVGFYRSGIPEGHGDTPIGGMTADGERLIGYSSRLGGGPRDSFTWRPGTPLVIAPDPAPSYNRYTGLSANGERAVGFRYDTVRGGNSAVTWDPVNGSPTILGYYSGRPNTYAWAVSGDATVVVGHAERTSGTSTFGEPVRWTEETGFVSLGQVFPGATNGRAVATNFDGSVAVGYGFDLFSGNGHAFRWTESAGYTLFPSILRLDAITPDGMWMAGASQWDEPILVSATGATTVLDPGHTLFSSAYALAMSADGNTIIGSGAPWSGPQTLFIWTQSEGIRRLDEYFQANGVSIPSGLTLSTEKIYCSADGLVIGGIGRNGLLAESWVAVLPSPSSFMIAISFTTLAVRRRR